MKFATKWAEEISTMVLYFKSSFSLIFWFFSPALSIFYYCTAVYYCCLYYVDYADLWQPKSLNNYEIVDTELYEKRHKQSYLIGQSSNMRNQKFQLFIIWSIWYQFLYIYTTLCYKLDQIVHFCKTRFTLWRTVINKLIIDKCIYDMANFVWNTQILK